MSTLIYILVITVIAFIAGYLHGKTIQIRELKDMESPEFGGEMTAEDWCEYFEEKEVVDAIDRKESLKVLDQLMTDDDFFTGDIAKSSKTETNIVRQPINPKRNLKFKNNEKV